MCEKVVRMDDYRKKMDRILQDLELALARSDAAKQERMDRATTKARELGVNTCRVIADAKLGFKTARELTPQRLTALGLLSENDVIVKFLELEIAGRENP